MIDLFGKMLCRLIFEIVCHLEKFDSCSKCFGLDCSLSLTIVVIWFFLCVLELVEQSG